MTGLGNITAVLVIKQLASVNKSNCKRDFGVSYAVDERYVVYKMSMANEKKSYLLNLDFKYKCR